MALSDFDTEAIWNTVSASTRLSPSFGNSLFLTPKPLAYTVFPSCTTATAIPGMPDFVIRSSAMPSRAPTASATAFSGSGIAGISGGGTADVVGAAA